MASPLSKMVVSSDETLKTALKVIDENAQGVCFVIENDQLLGLLTDGDIRRLILNHVDLNKPVCEYANKTIVSLPIDTTNEIIQKTLSDKIRHIPLVDENNRLVDYASRNRYRHIPLAEPVLDGNELAYVTECITTNWISSQGRFVKQFEGAFKEYIHVPHALAVSNGTVGLHLSLVALGIGVGDEVIVPDLTFAASINAVLYTGATPVLVDVDPVTWTIDPAEIVKVINKKTRAIMPVHLYGHPCMMDEILEIANENNLFVIEDCAEALGTMYKNDKVGSFGDAAVFSFFGNKTITTGEGGMVLFKNTEVATKAELLRDHGMNKSRRYWHDEVGFNYRLTNIQAAVGVAQLERVEYFIRRKREIATEYTNALQNISGLTCPGEKEWAHSTFWLFTILVNGLPELTRDDIIERLQKNGIEARPIFHSLHRMPLYKKYQSKYGCENSLSISNRGISLPSSVNTDNVDIEEICNTMKRILDVEVIKKEFKSVTGHNL